jgi:hypothetical protein
MKRNTMSIGREGLRAHATVKRRKNANVPRRIKMRPTRSVSDPKIRCPERLLLWALALGNALSALVRMNRSQNLDIHCSSKVSLLLRAV